ncbi:uncharacterized protein LOC127796174 [Diospyros lotus]|uniref:uncharacterized protein LOC127796174 n=1 Tax=Diospyros lotus TaxID=55363 RepID=UPI00224D0BB0|nr:uncharacterized protein LOC127796174 [Diospyros lotus]XP_052184146.1 uncharacterized protein LOC127796174 [Diospyros lotus]XP_052184147.1 uncharacterized protein LOC127796174 [Diospyros lotus]
MEDSSEEDSSLEGNDSKVRWLLGKGLELGRKIVITGIVISSVPLVVPPLVVVSAIGLAVSVPFGVVFASYVGTEKIMSKLLPRPTSPLMLENGTVFGEEEMCFGGDDAMEEEKEKQIEDLKESVEMRIELAQENDKKPAGEVDQSLKEESYKEHGREHFHTINNYECKSTVKNGEKPSFDTDQKEGEERYEEDVGEYLEGEDEGPLEENDVKIEGLRENGEETGVGRWKGKQLLDEVPLVLDAGARDKRNCLDVTVAEELDLDTTGAVERLSDENGSTYDEEQDIAQDTTGFLGKLKDEGDVTNTVEDDNQQGEDVNKITEEKNAKNFTNVEGMEQSSENGVESKNLPREMKGAEGKRRNEDPENEIQEKGNEELPYAVPLEVKQIVEMGDFIQGSRDGKKITNAVLEEASLGEPDGSKDGERPIEVAEILEEQRYVYENQTVSMVHEDIQLVRETEHAAHSNTDAREIADESGFEFDVRFDPGCKYSHAVDDNPEVHTQEGNEDLVVFSVSVEMPNIKNAGNHSEDTAMPDSKVLLGEEKVWEHIDALRTIVGYKAAPQATCLDELKALYIFTGVEPPASFRNPSGLAEVNDKLQFLMSIVGVK